MFASLVEFRGQVVHTMVQFRVHSSN